MSGMEKWNLPNGKKLFIMFNNPKNLDLEVAICIDPPVYW